jgi:hypothetical protein
MELWQDGVNDAPDLTGLTRAVVDHIVRVDKGANRLDSRGDLSGLWLWSCGRITSGSPASQSDAGPKLYR